jgi:hypothetical protein
MKSTEGTQTEKGSKWLKKKKRMSEVKEKQLVLGNNGESTSYKLQL